ncbi:hypothetical protein DPMN_191116 [Dreissena polymorpha]|uniref:Uncharacterized protein n=1 Tax=Dreissena polymorpha TaxID=45954 RepID=A0A9D3XY44_DREPO|nr:hypothetical protein DPMN_191116 [Dreissena polymorpha]
MMVDYKQANVTLEECGMGVVVIWHGEWFGWIHIRKKCPAPTGGHVFLSNWNQFQTCPDDRTINMASRRHVFPPTRTIFELIQDLIRTNHLTKFHNNRKINVAYRENAPPPDIIRTNLLTKFHEDKKIMWPLE